MVYIHLAVIYCSSFSQTNNCRVSIYTFAFVGSEARDLTTVSDRRRENIEHLFGESIQYKFTLNTRLCKTYISQCHAKVNGQGRHKFFFLLCWMT